MFLSVIIPVYNVEKYLQQCVDSVIHQQLCDIEIILVDDGSLDNSPQICDEYASTYEYIKVIHKENGGLSSARNVGLDVAQGKYIMFMDSDDWWNPEVNMNSVLKQVREQKDKEMFLFSSLDYVEGNGLYKRNEHHHFDKISTESVEKYYQSLLENGNLEVSAATKIIKLEFLRKNNLYFTPGIVSEDNEWMLRLLRCLNHVGVIDESIYIYRAGRKGSITNTIGLKNISDLLCIIEKSLSYYDDSQNNHVLKEKELCYVAYLWFSALGLSYKLKTSEKHFIKNRFEQTSVVCKYSNSTKTKLCYYVYKILGFQLTEWILGLYIKMKGRFQFGKQKLNAWK